jgi:uncharacterized protein
MDFEWDESKSETCYRERGFDFTYAARAFFDPGRVVRADTRWQYGEDRFKLLGMIEGRIFAVIFTKRQGAIRIISARRANSREVRQHENGAHQA